MSTWALYGATGYTGPLIAERAVERGHKPLLMGRSADKLAALGARLGLPFRAVSLDDPAALREALKGCSAVLHAAGPFTATSAPMVQACLDLGIGYLDITGEPDVFTAIYARDAEARARGVALVPGVGFDVVPSDALVAYVAAKVPDARTLEFAIAGIGRPSAGTVKSALPLVLAGGHVYRGGKKVPYALGRGIRRLRFPSRDAWVGPAPISDLDAAFRSTGIPDITAYYALPSRFAQLARVGWPVAELMRPLAKLAIGGGRLDGFIEKRVVGGTAETRSAGRSYLWAKAASDAASVEAWLETPEGYELTGHSAVRAVEALLEKKPSGALTPSQAFGKDFGLKVPGVKLLETLPLP